MLVHITCHVQELSIKRNKILIWQKRELLVVLMTMSMYKPHLHKTTSLYHQLEELVQVQRLLGHDGHSSDGITCSVCVCVFACVKERERSP